ncbi:MAG: 4Fe-4S dicluster domain-containing protein [Pseudomonadota bacterium]
MGERRLDDRYFALPAERLREMVSALMEDRPVYGPVAKSAQSGIPEDTPFWVYSRLQLAGQLALHFDVTIMPPKKLFFPPEEPILEYDFAGWGRPILHEGPFVVFGVHPYDLTALGQLDKVFNDRYPDAWYLARRRDALLVGVDPVQVAPHSFWASMDTASTTTFDLMLTDIGAGGSALYVVEVGSPKGAEALERFAQAEPASSGELAARDEVRSAIREKSLRHGLRFDVRELPGLLPKVMDSVIWDEKARTCYSCGTCNLVCPTCYCFDLRDEVRLDLTGGQRLRRWDGCQLEDFALIGACNFRPLKVSRYRHRLLRKGQYLYERYGDIACVGCGRCSSQCLPNIADPVDVYNRLHDEAKARGLI